MQSNTSATLGNWQTNRIATKLNEPSNAEPVFRADTDGEGRMGYPHYIQWVNNQAALLQVSYVLEDDTLFSTTRMPEEERPIEPAPHAIPDNASPELRLEYMKFNESSKESWLRDCRLYDQRVDKATQDLHTAIALFSQPIPYGTAARLILNECLVEKNPFLALRKIQDTFSDRFEYKPGSTATVDTLTELGLFTDRPPGTASQRIFLWKSHVSRAETAGVKLGASELLSCFIRGTTIPSLISLVIVPYEQSAAQNPDTTWLHLADRMTVLIKNHPEFNEHKQEPSTLPVKANNAPIVTPVAKRLPPSTKIDSQATKSVPATPCPYCNDTVDLHWARECEASSCFLCGSKFDTSSARQRHKGKCPRAAKSSTQPSKPKRKRESFDNSTKKKVKANQAETALLQRIAELEQKMKDSSVGISDANN
jgi:hypothetical protein